MFNTIQCCQRHRTKHIIKEVFKSHNYRHYHCILASDHYIQLILTMIARQAIYKAALQNLVAMRRMRSSSNCRLQLCAFHHWNLISRTYMYILAFLLETLPHLYRSQCYRYESLSRRLGDECCREKDSRRYGVGMLLFSQLKITSLVVIKLTSYGQIQLAIVANQKDNKLAMVTINCHDYSCYTNMIIYNIIIRIMVRQTSL